MNFLYSHHISLEFLASQLVRQLVIIEHSIDSLITVSITQLAGQLMRIYYLGNELVSGNDFKGSRSSMTTTRPATSSEYIP